MSLAALWRSVCAWFTPRPRDEALPAADAGYPLRVLAQDADDLAVISALLQDAVLTVADARFEPQMRQFTFTCNRLIRIGYPHRIRTAVQFGDVLAVHSRGVPLDVPNHVLQILSLSYDPQAGHVMMHGAGDVDLSLTVETLDAVLADVSDPWPVRRVPDHGIPVSAV
jgi:hypothetical protein